MSFDVKSQKYLLSIWLYIASFHRQLWHMTIDINPENKNNVLKIASYVSDTLVHYFCNDADVRNSKCRVHSVKPKYDWVNTFEPEHLRLRCQA